MVDLVAQHETVALNSTMEKEGWSMDEFVDIRSNKLIHLVKDGDNRFV